MSVGAAVAPAGLVVVGGLAAWLEAPFPELVTGVALDGVESVPGSWAKDRR